ncbi:hypothetical protein EC9_28110 [Rosistilla ulvae]|uniref:SLA1 homology domain-containing protein n=1 Tax=Rosistilla ulvae TaxID=1930277 RepID=A0A517M163_9BACT|nr:hypothetical protein [Rosistilla ulvae]QDS88620.1 hypothetical protein EC9_28110 [Rosistilla ulvae]
MITLRCALIGILVTSGLTAHAETWTTLNGQQFEATFRGMWGKAAIFERADGRRAAITLLNMNAESRIRLQKLSEEVDARRSQRVADLQQAADAAQMAAAAVPAAEGTATSLPPVVEYQPMADAMDLKSTISHLLDQSSSGHLRVYWDALPASYQRDIDQMRTDLTGKIPASQWDARIDLLAKVARVLQEKQSLLMGSSMLASFPAPMKDSVRDGLSPLVDQLATIMQQGQLSHEKVSQTELATLIAELSPELAGPMRKLLEATRGMSPVAPNIERMQIEQTDDSHGTVKDPAVDHNSTWTKVEQRWISDSVADDWTNNLQATGQQFESFFGEESNAKAAQIGTVVDGLLAAQDQQSFDAVIFQVVLQMGPMLKQFGVAPGMPGGL